MFSRFILLPRPLGTSLFMEKNKLLECNMFQLGKELTVVLFRIYPCFWPLNGEAMATITVESSLPGSIGHFTAAKLWPDARENRGPGPLTVAQMGGCGILITLPFTFFKRPTPKYLNIKTKSGGEVTQLGSWRNLPVGPKSPDEKQWILLPCIWSRNDCFYFPSIHVESYTHPNTADSHKPIHTPFCSTFFRALESMYNTGW